MGTFPFGWIRERDKENWQLLWNSETMVLHAKGATSKRVINIGQCPSWQEAKALAERVQNEPEFYISISKNE
jgi:uncharacterized circularly permuted ATP-grasp superfamily protein